MTPNRSFSGVVGEVSLERVPAGLLGIVSDECDVLEYIPAVNSEWCFDTIILVTWQLRLGSYSRQTSKLTR